MEQLKRFHRFLEEATEKDTEDSLSQPLPHHSGAVSKHFTPEAETTLAINLALVLVTGQPKDPTIVTTETKTRHAVHTVTVFLHTGANSSAPTRALRIDAFTSAIEYVWGLIDLGPTHIDPGMVHHNWARRM